MYQRTDIQDWLYLINLTIQVSSLAEEQHDRVWFIGCNIFVYLYNLVWGHWIVTPD